MRKSLAALATAAALSVAMVAIPQPTQAGWHGHGWHGDAFFADPRCYGYHGGPYHGYYGGPYGHGACWRERVWTHRDFRWQRYCC